MTFPVVVVEDGRIQTEVYQREVVRREIGNQSKYRAYFKVQFDWRDRTFSVLMLETTPDYRRIIQCSLNNYPSPIEPWMDLLLHATNQDEPQDIFNGFTRRFTLISRNPYAYQQDDELSVLSDIDCGRLLTSSPHSWFDEEPMIESSPQRGPGMIDSPLFSAAKRKQF